MEFVDGNHLLRLAENTLRSLNLTRLDPNTDDVRQRSKFKADRETLHHTIFAPNNRRRCGLFSFFFPFPFLSIRYTYKFNTYLDRASPGNQLGKFIVIGDYFLTFDLFAGWSFRRLCWIKKRTNYQSKQITVNNCDYPLGF